MVTPNRLSISTGSQLLSVGLEASLPVLLFGAPGIGKTEIVKAAARELGFAIEISHPVVSDPTDFKGIPFADNGVARFLPLPLLRKMMGAQEPMVVFFDDLGQAPEAVQAALMQVILAREVDGNKISNHVRFVAASNEIRQGAGVRGVLSPLISRFTVIYLTSDFAAFKNWAAASGKISALIVSFLESQNRKNLNMLNTFSEEKAKLCIPYACPRTWEVANRWLTAFTNGNDVNWELAYPAIAGCVGEDCALAFMTFCKRYDSVSRYVLAAEKNPDTAPLPIDITDQFLVCAGFALRSAKSSRIIPNAVRYLQRMNNEFVAYFFSIVPLEVRTSPEYTSVLAKLSI